MNVVFVYDSNSMNKDDSMGGVIASSEVGCGTGSFELLQLLME